MFLKSWITGELAKDSLTYLRSVVKPKTNSHYKFTDNTAQLSQGVKFIDVHCGSKSTVLKLKHVGPPGVALQFRCDVVLQKLFIDVPCGGMMRCNLMKG